MYIPDYYSESSFITNTRPSDCVIIVDTTKGSGDRFSRVKQYFSTLNKGFHLDFFSYFVKDSGVNRAEVKKSFSVFKDVFPIQYEVKARKCKKHTYKRVLVDNCGNDMLNNTYDYISIINYDYYWQNKSVGSKIVINNRYLFFCAKRTLIGKNKLLIELAIYDNFFKNPIFNWIMVINNSKNVNKYYESDYAIDFNRIDDSNVIFYSYFYDYVYSYSAINNNKRIYGHQYIFLYNTNNFKSIILPRVIHCAGSFISKLETKSKECFALYSVHNPEILHKAEIGHTQEFSGSTFSEFCVLDMDLNIIVPPFCYRRYVIKNDKITCSIAYNNLNRGTIETGYMKYLEEKDFKLYDKSISSYYECIEKQKDLFEKIKIKYDLNMLEERRQDVKITFDLDGSYIVH